MTETEAFPETSGVEPQALHEQSHQEPRSNGNLSTSSSDSRRRGISSISRKFLASNPPYGVWQATGEAAAYAPAVPEVEPRSGSFSYAVSRPRHSTVDGRPLKEVLPTMPQVSEVITHIKNTGPDETGTYPNGYRFPPKKNWQESTRIGLKAFWKFFLTPFGFLVTLYSLNVVAWGAMIFFLLLNAAPGMCEPDCDADNSPRRIWIEIDAQVLNALFCVTGFGLIPWRFRDFFWLLRWRIFRSKRSLRTLAGIHRNWFRLKGYQTVEEHVGPPTVYSKKNPRTPDSPPSSTEEEVSDLERNEALPLPPSSIPAPPLTGIRASPTKLWKLDFVVWMYVINTGFQVVLAFSMWYWSRFDRPIWIQAVSITVACLVAAAAGLLSFFEGKRVKKIEGVPWENKGDSDMEKLHLSTPRAIQQ